MKNFSKTLLILVLVILLGLAGLLGWLTMTEYNPDPIEELEPLSYQAVNTLPEGARLNVLSWNIGYAGLGAEQDFLMDGGQTVRPGEENVVRRYLKGIEETLQSGSYGRRPHLQHRRGAAACLRHQLSGAELLLPLCAESGDAAL